MAASKRSSTAHRGRTNASTRKHGGVWHVNSVPGASRSMLRRTLRYGEKFCGLWSRLRAVNDERLKPRVTAGRVVVGYVLLMLVRLGSLNALEQRQSWRSSTAGANATRALGGTAGACAILSWTATRAYPVSVGAGRIAWNAWSTSPRATAPSTTTGMWAPI
jgi:hypothetical protein